jgi:putative thioredoxin
MEKPNLTLDFEQDVLQASYSKPVLVDFWAEWCGPCRMLGPVLDQLAVENLEKWTLVKVDTEAYPDIASRYAIRSIPNVKLFHHGAPIAEFAGALSRTIIEKWLEEHLPDPVRSAWATLHPSLPPWPGEGVPPELQAFCGQHPDHEASRISRWAYAVTRQPEEARMAVEPIRLGHPYFEIAEHIRHLARWLEQDWTADHPSAKALKESRQALWAGDLDTTFKTLIEGLPADKHYAEDLLRLVLLALFQVRGEGDPMVQRYRKWFAMTLN